MAIWTNRGASQEGDACNFYGALKPEWSEDEATAALLLKVQFQWQLDTLEYILAGGRQKQVNSQLIQYDRSPQIVFDFCIE